jgi:hypothetical protein
MAVQIQGGSDTAGKANVDAGYNLNVTLPTDNAYVGKAILVSDNDSASNYLQSPETTDDYRLRVGVDTILTDRLFNYAAQDTGFEIYRNTTMTFTWSSLALNTNGSGITTRPSGPELSSRRLRRPSGSAPSSRGCGGRSSGWPDPIPCAYEGRPTKEREHVKG